MEEKSAGFFGKWHPGGFKEKDGRAAFCVTDPERRGGFHEWIGGGTIPRNKWLCGVPVPDWMHGRDGSGLRLKEKDLPENVESGFLQIVIPTCHSYSIDRPWRGVVTQDGWKYCAFEGQPFMMHHLAEDPYEQVNLAFNSRYWLERKRLQEEIACWMQATGDTFALPER